MRYLITSDVHIGSPFCESELFVEMLRNLGPSVTLILAGDSIDAPGRLLSVDAQAALDAVLNRATRAPVIWLEGNHDDGYCPGSDRADASADIRVEKSYAIGQRLFITHGDTFDNVMPRNQWFVVLFNFFHKLRVRLGAQPVHVADYAKCYRRLYGVLCRKVMSCAVDHAEREKYGAVVCGHVHFAEDRLSDGIRYINLGAWTEKPCHCLLVDEETIEFVRVEDAMRDPDWFDGAS